MATGNPEDREIDGSRWPLPSEDLAALFARNIHHVRAFVRLRIDPLTRSRDSISDIVQSACRELLEKESFEYRDEKSFRSYLCQAALFKIQNRRRHHAAEKRHRLEPGPESPGDDELAAVYRTTLFDPSRPAILKEEIVALERAFDQLPEDYRQALTLYRIVGLSTAEIAQQCGRTEAATKMLLHRAMARLTSILARPDDSR